VAPVPRYPDPPRQLDVLVEDLLRALSQTTDAAARCQLLASLVVILPTVPDEMPEWMATLERSVVVPRVNDLAFLLKSLADAIPVQFKKARGPGKLLSVVVRPDDPAAIPISIENMRTELKSVRERLRADIGTANGRLNEDFLDVPPQRDVCTLLSAGFGDLLDKGEAFGPHEGWPLIASGLSAQGTPGPYWFIVRRTTDHPQLLKQLQRAGKLNSILQRRLPEIDAGLAAIESSKPSATFAALVEELQKAEDARERLRELVEKSVGRSKALPEELADAIAAADERDDGIGQLVAAVLQSPLTIAAINYWARVLCECATETSDALGISKLLTDERDLSARTAARKALRLIDFKHFGPPAPPRCLFTARDGRVLAVEAPARCGLGLTV